jgi:hypothetical protein
MGKTYNVGKIWERKTVLAIELGIEDLHEGLLVVTTQIYKQIN